MKLQIISALTLLFFMMLFSFVKLQITPTKYGTQISFGQELQPVTHPKATAPIISDGECYSIISELKEHNSKSMTAAIDQGSELQREQIEKIINHFTTSTDQLQRINELETNENLP